MSRVPGTPQTKERPPNRRHLDYGKLVPVLGVFLFFLPLLWPQPADDQGVRMSAAMSYIFLCWCLLILGAAAFGHALKRAGRQTSHPTEPK